jgi:hypothetical protein
MSRSVKEIVGYVLGAIDGDIGRCDDFLFDDRDWMVRFMVAKTAKWLPGRKVVVSPAFLGQPDWTNRRLPVRLTRQQIEDSPPLDEHAPVSRAYEIGYWRHYSQPPYSGVGSLPPYGPGPGGFGSYPWPAEVLSPTPEPTTGTEIPERKEELLHSVEEVLGYGIAATDREIGQVNDFILDDQAWTLRYLVVDTGYWLPGRKVLVSTSWLGSIDWAEQRLHVELDAESIRNGPEFDPTKPLDRRYEIEIHDYYGRPYYW